jgi:hypothetical protein
MNDQHCLFPGLMTYMDARLNKVAEKKRGKRSAPPPSSQGSPQQGGSVSLLHRNR